MPVVIPTPRGPLSDALLAYWRGGPTPEPHVSARVDPLVDDDLQLALWCCYELHYHGFEGVDEDMEWDAATLEFRAALEERFEAALRNEHSSDAIPADPEVALRVLASRAGPPLSSTMEREGARWQLEEFAIHRSAYQLKEADPHTWAIPRLTGDARAAMVEIQIDEYGGGRPGRSHAELFAAAMEELGLVSDFGHYVDHLPGPTLATDNLVSMFGLHRRLRYALVGHLALFETTSPVPMARYLAAVKRIGGLPAVERFYEVHVEADAHHSVVALKGMVGPLVLAHPSCASEVIFGAAALGRVEARFARHILQAWDQGRSSLRAPGLAPRMPTVSAMAPSSGPVVSAVERATEVGDPADEPAGQVA